MSQKSLVDELQQLQLAVELIELGARLQVLETETEISRARLVKLYKEVRGVSPPKGMLPFSTDWFMTWQPILHASLCHGFYGFVIQGQTIYHGRTQSLLSCQLEIHFILFLYILFSLAQFTGHAFKGGILLFPLCFPQGACGNLRIFAHRFNHTPN